MSGRTIEAKAVISASDRTGNVFDKIASKFRGLEKNAKAMEGIKPLKFTGNLDEELKRLKLTEKELQSVRKAQAALQAQLMSDPVGKRAAHYFRAMDDWKNRTVSHWREIKANVDETDKAHRKFFAGAGRFALAASGVAGGAYMAGRVARAGIKANAEGQRETARDYLAGMTEAESKRIEDASLQASKRYQSVDSQTMHERLRDTAMSTRSTDKALELADTIGQMTTVLQSLKGKDQAIEEGRKFFQALDVMGKNLDPREIRELADGYVKALGVEGADMNLGGVLAMSKRLKSASATVSNRFLMTTGVGLGRDMGDERAGNAVSMMMQQEVQATKQAKAYGQKYGLRDSTGKFADRSSMMSDPDFWAWKNISAAMNRAKLDPNKAEDVTTFLQSAYSNSSARDVLSKLMTQRDQYEGKAVQFGRAPGLSAAGPMMTKDPFVAYEAVFAQLRTLAGQAPIMDGAAQGLNALSSAISGLNEAAKDGWIKDVADKAKKTFDTDKRDAAAIWDVGKKVFDWDRATASNMPSLVPQWMGGPAGWWPNASYPAGEDPMGSDYQRRQFRSKEFWKGLGREGASAESAARLRRESERLDAAKYSFAAPGLSKTLTYGTGVKGGDDKALSVSGEVQGEAALSIKIEAPELIKAYYDAQKAISLVGQITSNGVGSTGKSSPDAAAPATPAQPTAP